MDFVTSNSSGHNLKMSHHHYVCNCRLKQERRKTNVLPCWRSIYAPNFTSVAPVVH